MAFHVYSTATAGVDFTAYQPSRNMSPNRPIKKVSVAGGSNVANKQIITPYGVRTEVSDEDADFLKDHPVFQRMEAGGFMRLIKSKKDPEKVITSEKMQVRDGSAPETPETILEKGAKPFTGFKKEGANA